MKKINKNKKQKRNDKAITLIALVVTIIILLILAGVAVGFATNGTGLFEKAKLATGQYNNKAQQEDSELAKIANNIDNVTSTRDSQDTSPIGTVIAFYGKTAPTGYLSCDGAEYNISDYTVLANLIKDTTGSYGTEISGKFKVPNLQGEFLRGAGNNSHTNSSTGLAEGSGGAVGEHQEATKHVGVIGDVKYTSLYLAKGTEENADSTQSNTESVRGAAASTGTTNLHNYTSRPTNTSVLYCIKAK